MTPDKQTVFKDGNDGGNGGGNKTSIGLEPNIAGLLCYLGGFITGIIFFLLEKENRFVRFHAMQSIAIFVSILILSIVFSFVPFVGWILSLLLAPLSFVLWILCMFKAYQGELYKLPWVGDFAESQINKE